MPRTSTRRRREAAEYSKSIRNSSTTKKASAPEVQEMDLSVVDKAYGDYADLYGDVLRVSATATHEHIQLAYFDRRSELFTLLAKIDAKSQDSRTEKERRQAERKMDSVVLAVRILGDSASREQYDQVRQSRMLNRRRSKQNHFDGDYSKVSRRATFQEKPVTSEVRYSSNEPNSNERRSRSRSKPSSSGRSSGRTPNKSSRRGADLDDTLNTYEMTDEETDADLDRSYLSYETDEFRQDDTTVGSGTIGTMTIGESTVGSGTIGTNTLGETTLDAYTVITMDEDKIDPKLFCGNSGFARKFQKEVNGAFQDTVASFDQVFNAFTLTDKDIRAVTKRIDKAKRQLDD
mmetsp:Transcript_32210/g.78274  ORF Transcript_32210/g.78274 Transcript_32210/m.78274 type:complete len:347 (+) Transcript_32210:109-1149(+)|eukprot:CAMPEP_0113636464 /NCGR_PEP_ID=MMETSP0017_2-20120614/19038_1 /TAXON_ID=2856 /ORGANISM="Cylindrotheca closterium" /LENGTH=346 /DNA_ID=CAMNT_0000547349 /DNA_START=61 /DNA_END=1101 /DNA_ORIENTATION=+ /assembly_acc=CAM_ASM_000147